MIKNGSIKEGPYNMFEYLIADNHSCPTHIHRRSTNTLHHCFTTAFDVGQTKITNLRTLEIMK